MSAYLMRNGFKQAGGTADIACLYDIAELLVQISNSFGLSTARR